MKITDAFKTAIGDRFYDKVFTILATTSTKDDEGVTTETVEDSTTFKGNINFSSLDKVQKDYGISEEINATISTHANIEGNTKIKFLDKKFKVIRSIPSDSHYLLIIVNDN